MLELKKDPFVVLSFTVLAIGLGVLAYFKVITWPQLLAGLGVLLTPSVLGRKKDDSPGPPAALVLLLVGSAVFPLTTGCAGATTQQKAAEAEASYTAAHAKCASTEPTPDAVDACRARVREEWHLPARGAR